MSLPPFIPGLELNRAFFSEVLGPLIDRAFPGLSYAAGLIGYGSDVLGFDTAISMDHNWGPRCVILLEDGEPVLAASIKDFLSANLPTQFRGFPTNYTDPRYDSTQAMEGIERGPVRHLVVVEEADSWFGRNMGIRELAAIEDPHTWLAFREQALIELTAGELFHDGAGRATALRARLAFWPEDIRKLRLAVLWRSVWNAEAFVGRCAELGDELGTRLTAGRIVSSLLKICFYLERRYIPYGKWFGTAFRRLDCAPRVLPLAKAALSEGDAAAIEGRLCTLYAAVVALHNLTPGLPRLENAVRKFFGRPYRVIFAESIVSTLVESVEDLGLRETDLGRIAIDLKAESADIE